jgi:VIT1/CCC1 family predicted Fe2+/Mn2+ transporter
MVGSRSTNVITARANLMAQMKWVRRFPEWAPRSTGGAEIAGAFGLILPWATGILPVLTPTAGACLLVLTVGAVKAHVDDGEPMRGVVALILALFALGVAAGRYATLR